MNKYIEHLKQEKDDLKKIYYSLPHNCFGINMMIQKLESYIKKIENEQK